MAYPIEQIRANALDIRRRVNTAAGGRPVALLAACKTQPPELLAACADFDFDFFGENRAQELVRNYAAGAYGAKRAHFIGALQTNKVPAVVGRAELIHSVDTEKLLSAIDKEAQKRGLIQDVLIEVNIGAEGAKSGVAPDEVEKMLERASRFCGLRVRGLMAIPPKAQENSINEMYFKTLYKLFIDMKDKKYDNVIMEILSMGMSGDFETAVRCGANLVRVGSALFGPRQPA